MFTAVLPFCRMLWVNSTTFQALKLYIYHSEGPKMTPSPEIGQLAHPASATFRRSSVRVFGLLRATWLVSMGRLVSVAFVSPRISMYRTGVYVCRRKKGTLCRVWWRFSRGRPKVLNTLGWVRCRCFH